MSGYQAWLLNQGREFGAGYDAACGFEPRDAARSAEWLRGFDHALGDLAKD